MFLLQNRKRRKKEYILAVGIILHGFHSDWKTGKPGKWESIYKSGKCQGIFIRILKKSGRFDNGKFRKILEKLENVKTTKI